MRGIFNHRILILLLLVSHSVVLVMGICLFHFLLDFLLNFFFGVGTKFFFLFKLICVLTFI